MGRIADRGAEYVPAREWMRICFELLEMLKAHKKGIRRATVNTFGYIAKAIGPQDVLVTLLNNLKVQERQNRVCTTVAIAIVAETCSPFTVLPALMNEYKVCFSRACHCRISPSSDTPDLHGMPSCPSGVENAACQSWRCFERCNSTTYSTAPDITFPLLPEEPAVHWLTPMRWQHVGARLRRARLMYQESSPNDGGCCDAGAGAERAERRAQGALLPV